MEKPREKAKRKSRAIALSLAEALRVVEQIHRQGGGAEVPMKSLGTIVDSKETSSLFHRKVAALKSYGVIEVHGEMVALSPLGKAYATPVSPENKKQAMLQAFRNIPLFDGLINRFEGKPLPAINEFFHNLVAQSFKVPHEEAPKWIGEFIDGAKLTDILVTEDGQEVVRLSSLAGVPSSKPRGGAPAMEIKETLQTGEVVDARIFGGGLSINLPDKINADDLQESIDAAEMLLKMLEAKLKKLKKEAGEVTH